MYYHHVGVGDVGDGGDGGDVGGGGDGVVDSVHHGGSVMAAVK